MPDFDNLQSSWDKAEGIDDERLRSVVERVQDRGSKMKSVLDARDLSEITTAAIMCVGFSFFAWFFSDNFFLWLGSLIVVAACVEITLVLMWGRRGIGARPEQLSVRDFTLHQRRLIRRQMFLLRSVLWWYLLPIYVGLMVMNYGFGDLYVAMIFGTLMTIMYWRIWQLNQEAVVTQLKPLDDAYTTTLESLDSPDEDLVDRSLDVLNAEPEKKTSRTAYQIGVLFVVLILCIPIFSLIHDARHSYERLSPYAGVRWAGGDPEVYVDGVWYGLVKIDDVDASEIVRYSRFRYLGLSKKRFSEDLVQLLSQMGHPPGQTSVLTVRSIETGELLELADVEWTADNRRRIKRANDDQENDHGDAEPADTDAASHVGDIEKLAPYAAIRWVEERPQIRIGWVWYALSSVDEVPVDDILAECRRRYGERSRKRFEEDLVQVLSEMGHPPGRRTDLTVRNIVTGEKRVLHDVAWTRANRDAIRRANMRRGEDMDLPAADSP